MTAVGLESGRQDSRPRAGGFVVGHLRLCHHLLGRLGARGEHEHRAGERECEASQRALVGHRAVLGRGRRRRLGVHNQQLGRRRDKRAARRPDAALRVERGVEKRVQQPPRAQAAAHRRHH